MDTFNVPKKVNRHVLKALNLLSDGNCKEGVTTARILHQVKFQMRNLVPVPNIDNAVQKSLKNMSEIGLIERHGSHRYAIGHNYAAPPAAPPPRPNTTGPDRRMFRGTENRKRSRSDLDPNLKRNRNSEESLSGDDFDRARKRIRSNNKTLKHTGRTTFLPRARQHSKHRQAQPNCCAAIDMPLFANVASEFGYSRSRENIPRNLSQLNLTPATGNSNLEFLLATVTPVPSIEIIEVSEEIQKIIGVRTLIETPPPTHVADNEPAEEHDVDTIQRKSSTVGRSSATKSVGPEVTLLAPADNISQEQTGAAKNSNSSSSSKKSLNAEKTQVSPEVAKFVLTKPHKSTPPFYIN